MSGAHVRLLHQTDALPARAPSRAGILQRHWATRRDHSRPPNLDGQGGNGVVKVVDGHVNHEQAHQEEAAVDPQILVPALQ